MLFLQRFKEIFASFTRNERLAFLVFAPLAVISCVAVIGIVIARTTVVVPAAGGTYTEGVVGQPEYVNPVTASSETDRSLVKMIYSNIYDIADSVQPSADGRAWTIRLREKLKWQDGEKLTSDDVIFTVQSIQNPDAGSSLYQSWQGVAVSRVSELELQFNLANPYAFFEENLRNLYILPKHLFANALPGNWRLSDYNLKPVGSGPYEFVSYDKRSDGTIAAYDLRTWDDYHGTPALISRFNFQFFANATDMVRSFNIGQLDGMGSLNANDLVTIERPYDLFSWRSSSYYAVFWNQSKNLALQDIRVREALSTAIDRDGLVTNVLTGHGAKEFGPIPEGAPYFSPITTNTSLDLASSSLTDAGWKLNAEGKRTKTIQKTAVPLVINLAVPRVPFLERTAQAVADAWRKISVTVNIAASDPQALVNGTIKNRDYEALIFGNILGANSDLYAFWNSSQRFFPGLNLAIYNNKKVDSFIEKARMQMNVSSRTATFASAQAAIAADFPAAFLYSPDYLYVTGKNVQGIPTGFIADPSDRFRGVKEWYLNTARVLK